MVEDEDLRRADKVLRHLATLSKSYGQVKSKQGRDLLLEKTLQGGTGCMDAVRNFLNDKDVLKNIQNNAAAILQGHRSKLRYNTCLGFLAARIMFL